MQGTLSFQPLSTQATAFVTRRIFLISYSDTAAGVARPNVSVKGAGGGVMGGEFRPGTVKPGGTFAWSGGRGVAEGSATAGGGEMILGGVDWGTAARVDSA